MKRVLIASLALAAMTLGGAPATATGQPVGTDSVTGAASDCVLFVELVPGSFICARGLDLDVDVESGPAGQNPTGTVRLRSLGLTPGGSATIVAEATCLSVSGGVAIIGVTGTFDQGGLGLEYPLAGLLRVVDAGGPNSAADTFALAYELGEAFGAPLPGPTTCASFPGPFPTDTFFFPGFTNDAGDVVVTDAPALPTTKDQCRNAGWKNFGVFRNQGDCVSFVATKGTNPAANP